MVPLPIRYSLRAQEEELDLLEYIETNFGTAKAREVYERIEKVLVEIAQLPEMYPESITVKGLRKCVFSKQTSIYYRIHNGYIEVVSFRPNRKNPSRF